MYFAYKFLLSRKVVQHSLLHAVLTAAVLSRQSLDQFVHRDSYHATAKHAQHACRDSLQKCFWASFAEQIIDNLGQANILWQQLFSDFDYIDWIR